MNQTPKFKNSKFQCPHCKTLAQQNWVDVKSASKTINAIIQHFYFDYRTQIDDYDQKSISRFITEVNNFLQLSIRNYIPERLSIATCKACNDFSLWIDGILVLPKKMMIPNPNPDIDEDIKDLYKEASSIITESPKGATALLRLCLQKLLIQLGKNGKNINNDIKELVAEGLSPKIQRALDILRVIGNNAVHPGQINIDDNKEIALKLFSILNFIADEMITKPKELETLYNEVIPEKTKEHINQRDGI